MAKQDMKTVVFSKRSRSRVLHVETEGCIVNITIGLSDADGREVTSVEVLPDRYVGDEWKLADSDAQAVNVRVVRTGP